MAKSYFSISNLFDASKFNNGNTFKIDLQSIKVDGNEQLTSDYFTEITPAFVDPHSANLWQFGTCTQSGAYPNTTAYASCSIGAIPNSFNPFADAFKVNYDTTVDGLARGEILNTVSGNTYGLEQFGFGFDLLDTPVNDIVGGGSTGATLEGCFYLDVDYTQDFEMIIQVTEKDSLGAVISDKTHIYSHQVVNCTFDYEIDNGGYQPTTDAYLWSVPTDAANWQFVDAGNGFAYAAAGRSGYILKLEIATGNLTTFGSFVTGAAIPPQYTLGILNPANGKIYFMSYIVGALDILVLDTSNDSYYTFGSFLSGEVPNPFNGLTITPSGIIYASSSVSDKFYKIDTNLETITTLTEIGAAPNGTAEYSTNGFVYFVSGAGEFYKLDTSNDNITTVVEPLIVGGFFDSYIDSNGVIYGVTSTGDFMSIDTLNSDTVTSTPITSPNIGSVRNISQMSDGNAYSIDQLDGKVYKLDINSFTSSEVYTLTNIYSYLPTTAIGDSIYSISTTAGEEILKLEFEFAPTVNGKPTSFLSGGLSGWIVPSCQSAPLLSDQPIVTESIGVLAQAQTQTVNIFDPTFIKQCCYFSPVLADPISTDSWKNDYNSFIFKRDFATETIDLVLLKDGGALNNGLDIPLVDNTYGEFGNFGFAGTSNLKSYKIEWQKVLLQQGEGSYQIQGTLGLVTGVEIQTSLVFQLKVYSQERAKGTVRIESSMKGYLKHLDFDYSAFLNGWKDSIRVKGFFGNRQAEYEQENIIYQNRTSRQLRSEMINTYTLQTLHIPSCVTDLIIEYHNFANWLNITDYNPVNHKSDYVEKKVVFDSMEEIEYKSVTSKAPLVCKYKDYLQNYQKDNC